MGVSITATSSTVTITASVVGNLPKPSSSQTIVSGVATINSNTTTTLKTVTAGKTLYVMGMSPLSNGASGDGATFNFLNDGTSFCKMNVAGYISCTPQTLSSSTPLTSVAATKVFGVTTGGIGGTVQVNWWGWEE